MKIPPEMAARVARAMWMEFHRDEDPTWAAAAWDDMGGSEPSDERANYEYVATAALAAAFKCAEVEMKNAAVHPFATERGWPARTARVYTARWVERG